MINLKNISHSFDNKKVLDDISFCVDKGEVLALLGENGVGKTTLMRIIAGFIKPTKGKIFILDKDISENIEFAKLNIGYMPEGAPLYQDMRVSAFLRFIAEAKGIKKSEINDEIARVVEVSGLNNVVKSDIAVLSKGYKRRVSLAAAIISDPKILLLDEPAEGLDPNQKSDFKARLKEMDKAIIISSHVLEDVRAFSTKVAIMHEGKINFMQKLAEIENKDLNELFRKQTKSC